MLYVGIADSKYILAVGSLKKTNFYFFALKIYSKLCLLNCMVWIKSVSWSRKTKENEREILKDPEDSWLKIIISEITLISILNSHWISYVLLKEYSDTSANENNSFRNHIR